MADLNPGLEQIPVGTEISGVISKGKVGRAYMFMCVRTYTLVHKHMCVYIHTTRTQACTYQSSYAFLSLVCLLADVNPV